MTPMHDGSRTPIHGSSAWDPTASATPRATEFDDWNNDPSPSPSGPSYLNPPTPGFANPDTPQGPYTPQTPGMYASADHTYSPYGTAGTPSPSGASYQVSVESLLTTNENNNIFII